MYIIIKKNSTFIFIHNSVKAMSKVCISKMSEHVKLKRSHQNTLRVNALSTLTTSGLIFPST